MSAARQRRRMARALARELGRKAGVAHADDAQLDYDGRTRSSEDLLALAADDGLECAAINAAVHTYEHMLPAGEVYEAAYYEAYREAGIRRLRELAARR